MDKFSNIYKQQFEKIEQIPPLESWDEIAFKLDVNEVWLNIDSRLQKKRTKRRLLIYSLNTIVILGIFSLIISTYLKSLDLEKNNLSITKNKLKSFYLNNHKRKQINNLILNNKCYNNIEIHKKIDNLLIYNQKNHHINNSNLKNQVLKTFINKSIFENAQKSDVIVIDSFTNKNNLLSNLDFKNRIILTDSIFKNNLKITSNEKFIKVENISIETNDNIDSTYNKIILISSDSILDKKDSINEKLKNKLIVKEENIKDSLNEFYGIYFGITGNINSVWLYNNLTINGFKTNSLNSTNLTYGKSYGFNIGYNSNKLYALELNFNLQSNVGQNYNLYQNGHYYNKIINLNYYDLNLSYKFRSAHTIKLLNSQISRNFIIGANLNILKSGQINFVSKYDNKNEDVNKTYSKLNYGIRFGYEFELLLNKYIILNTALLSDVGIKPINLKNERTTTIVLGVNLGIKYLFK